MLPSDRVGLSSEVGQKKGKKRFPRALKKYSLSMYEFWGNIGLVLFLQSLIEVAN